MSVGRADWSFVHDEARLDELVGRPIPRVADKARATLDEIDRRWLAASPMCLVATSAADGSCDVSPRGDPTGQLVHVLDERTDTLRINGAARIVDDAPFFDELVVAGHRPKLALVVDVHEVFYHCSKAFLRSKLWDPATWDASRGLPSRAQIVKALEAIDETLEELERHYGPGYADKLYRA